MQRPSDIPVPLWRAACEKIHHALSITDLQHRYIWANEAFCRLVGYSLVELQAVTWKDVTVSGDVAGDLASLNKMLDGEQDSYTNSKRFRHKILGHEVACDNMVWRYPPSGRGEPIVAVIVESIPQTASKAELDNLHHECRERFQQLVARLEQIESSRETARRSREMVKKAQEKSNIFNVGNSTNSSDIIRYLVWGLVIGVLSLVAGANYLMYIGGWGNHQGGASPPPTPVVPAPLSPATDSGNNL